MWPDHSLSTDLRNNTINRGAAGDRVSIFSVKIAGLKNPISGRQYERKEGSNYQSTKGTSRAISTRDTWLNIPRPILKSTFFV